MKCMAKDLKIGDVINDPVFPEGKQKVKSVEVDSKIVKITSNQRWWYAGANAEYEIEGGD